MIKNKSIFDKLKEGDLSNADLRCIDLRSTNLRCINLRGTNLSFANLRGADLKDANLTGANLINANLINVDLRGTNLSYANLRGTDLTGANLRGADLTGVHLRDANLPFAEYRKGKILENRIIGYKKCLRVPLVGRIKLSPIPPIENSVIVTLEIPRGAIVFSINGTKFRTNVAKVIAIEGGGRAYSMFNNMSYYVGDVFTVYDFNCEYNVECAPGIHFYMTKKDAEQN